MSNTAHWLVSGLRWRHEPCDLQETEMRPSLKDSLIPDLPNILAGNSIAVLGSSGRPEVPALLEQLKVQPSFTERYTDGRRTLHSSVVDAAFAYDMVSQHGQDYYKTIYGTETLFRVFSQWKQSDKGRPWIDWYRAGMGLPPLERKPIQSQP